MRPALDLRLYLVTDPSTPGGIVDMVRAAVRGGVTLVQLRDKQAPIGEFIALGRSLAEALAPTGVPLIINDRIEAVRPCGAAGLHVGQSDMAPTDARRLLGPDAVIGLSITEASQLRDIDCQAVDYLGIGPVHATPVKPDHAPPIGHDGLALICAAARHPAVAIGGLTSADAAPARRAGAAGIAVVTAIVAASDPEAAARSLRAAWDGRSR